MRDMNPRGDRSIRNIPVSANHRRVPATPMPIDEDFVDEMPPPPKRSSGGRAMKLLWWILGTVLVCVVAGLIISTVFEGAQITIHPKTETVTPPSAISAQLNATDGTLSYQSMSVSQSASTSVTASGTENVSKSASGPVTIYNAYSTASQALIASTRFEAPDGKIYRIHEAVTIPGTTKKSDGTVVPGSVTAVVYADAPGAEYNRSDSTKFTIPGFKSDPRYTKFYAQSQGPISGGLVGSQPAVSAAVMTTAQNTLKNQLDSAIRTAVGANIPNGFIPVTGSQAVTYASIVQTKNSDTSATLSQGATATVFIVKAADLAAAVAKQTVQGYQGESINFADPSAVTATLTSTNKTATTPITFSLGGSATLVWQFDQDAVKTALLGKDKTDFESIIKSFQPAIVKAEASIRPFWKATFPTDPSQLSIKITE